MSKLLLPQSDLSQWRASCNGEHTRLLFHTVAKLAGGAAASAAAAATASGAATPAAASSAGVGSNPTTTPIASSPQARLPSGGASTFGPGAGGSSTASLAAIGSQASGASSVVDPPSPLAAVHLWGSGVLGVGGNNKTTPGAASPANTHKALVSQGEYCWVAVVPQKPSRPGGAAGTAPSSATTMRKSNSTVVFEDGTTPGSTAAAAAAGAASSAVAAPSATTTASVSAAAARNQQPHSPKTPLGHQQQQQQLLLQVTGSAIMVWSRDGTAVTRCVGGHDYETEGPILELSAVETVGRYYSMFATSTASSIVLWLVRPLAKPPQQFLLQQQQQPSARGGGRGASGAAAGVADSMSSAFGGHITPPILPQAGGSTPQHPQSNSTSGRNTPYHHLSPHFPAAVGNTSAAAGSGGGGGSGSVSPPNPPTTSTTAGGGGGGGGSRSGSTPKPGGAAPGAAAAATSSAVPCVLFDVAHVAMKIRSSDLPQEGLPPGTTSTMLRTPTLFVPDPSPIQHGGLFVTADVLFFFDAVSAHGGSAPSSPDSKNASEVANESDLTFGSDASTASPSSSSSSAAPQKPQVVSRSVCRTGVGLALPAVNDPPIVQFEKPLEFLQEDRLTSAIVKSTAASEGTSRAQLPLMATSPPLFAFSISDERIVTAPPDSCSTTPSWNPCEDCPGAPLLSIAWLPMPSFAVYGAAAAAAASSQSVDTSTATAGAGSGGAAPVVSPASNNSASTSNTNTAGSSAVITTGVSHFKRLVCATATRILICRIAAGGQPDKLQKIVNGADGVFFRKVSCSFEGKIWIEYAAPQSVRVWKQQRQQRHLRMQAARAASDNQTPFGQGCTNLGGDDDEDGLGATAAAVSASVIAAASPATSAAAVSSIAELTVPQLQILQTMQQTFLTELTCVVLPIHSSSGGGAGAYTGASRFGFGSDEMATTSLRISELPARMPNSPFTMASIFQQKFSPTHVGPQFFAYDAVRRRLCLASLQSFVESTQPLPSATVVPRYMKFSGTNNNSSSTSCSPTPGTASVSASASSGAPTRQKFKFGPFAPIPTSGITCGKTAFGKPASSSATSADGTAAADSTSTVPAAAAPAPKAWKFGSAAPPGSSSGTPSGSATPAQPQQQQNSQPFSSSSNKGAAAAASFPTAAAAAAAGGNSNNTTPLFGASQPPLGAAPPTPDMLFGSDMPIRTNPEADTSRFGRKKEKEEGQDRAGRPEERAKAAREILSMLKDKGLLSEEALAMVAGGEESVVEEASAIMQRILFPNSGS